MQKEIIRELIIYYNTVACVPEPEQRLYQLLIMLPALQVDIFDEAIFSFENSIEWVILVIHNNTAITESCSLTMKNNDINLSISTIKY